MGISLPRATLSLIICALLTLAGCGGDDGPGPSAGDSGNPSGDADPPASDPSDGQDPGQDPAPGEKNAPPQISGTPQPTVLQETEYVFEPEADDADGDILHFTVANLPPWAQFETATGRIEGVPAPGDVGTYAGISIRVTDGAADADLAPFSITVTPVAAGAVELTWAAPTQNVDGSPLTDLAGYKLYWGTEPEDFSNSITIDSPGTVTYVIEDLVPATYYFIATAVNEAGIESDPSDMTSLTIS